MTKVVTMREKSLDDDGEEGRKSLWQDWGRKKLGTENNVGGGGSLKDY